MRLQKSAEAIVGDGAEGPNNEAERRTDGPQMIFVVRANRTTLSGEVPFCVAIKVFPSA